MIEVVFIEERPEAGREHRVAADASIGREPSLAVVLDDPQVSRRHARLCPVGSGVGVEDLGSTHGTFVNGEPMSGVRELAPGDRVTFGDTVWRLQPVAAEPVAVPAREVPRGEFREPTIRRRGSSAARSLQATAVAYGVVGATAVALVLYFAQS